jgi:hypothetical protein
VAYSSTMSKRVVGSSPGSCGTGFQAVSTWCPFLDVFSWFALDTGSCGTGLPACTSWVLEAQAVLLLLVLCLSDMLASQLACCVWLPFGILVDLQRDRSAGVPSKSIPAFACEFAVQSPCIMEPRCAR